MAWWQSRIRGALDLGADGFMQDFGEQVQADMHFADGEVGATMHNRYPVLYHAVTRQAVEDYQRAHPARQLFFFTRAGYSGTPGSAASEGANFPGDETTDFSRSAGLASQTTDMLNRAVGGAYGFSTDIGGYFDLGPYQPTTKELFLRWAEWAALSPLFRLHGSVLAGTHTPWSYDQQTVAVYEQLARLHASARSLILRLWQEAAHTGVPITRPLWLAYPGDTTAAAQDQEWLLGPDVLVAPVVEQGVASRSVYFPAGCWQSPGASGPVNGPISRTVAAGLDTLPYYFRCGTHPFNPPSGARVTTRATCARPGILRFRVHQNNGRVYAVKVYAGRRLLRVLRARRIRMVSVRRPARPRFTLRIYDYTARHTRVLTTRRYGRCTKTRPITRVRHLRFPRHPR